MRYLTGDEEQQALECITLAVEIAQQSTCQRSRCGSVIVKDELVVGFGYNSPPADLESQRRCHVPKETYHQKVTDKTCCIHAEQRAIIDAIATNPEHLGGSRLYFIRLDGNAQPSRAGEPYCTHCSKLALDVGIAEFVLWHEQGVCVYDTEEYNLLSYQYGGKK